MFDNIGYRTYSKQKAHKHWAGADNIFAAGEHMAAFRLCENHNNFTVYLL
jgi:hypothetical protein